MSEVLPKLLHRFLLLLDAGFQFAEAFHQAAHERGLLEVPLQQVIPNRAAVAADRVDRPGAGFHVGLEVVQVRVCDGLKIRKLHRAPCYAC